MPDTFDNLVTLPSGGILQLTSLEDYKSHEAIQPNITKKEAFLGEIKQIIDKSMFGKGMVSDSSKIVDKAT